MAATNEQARSVKRVMIFGGSGMVGKGVVQECLQDERVEQVVTVGRSQIGIEHEKLKEVMHTDFMNFEAIEEEMKKVDACFYTLGVSSLAVDKPTYERITRDFTVSAGTALLKHNPNMTFIYVSGMGTDTESSLHWAQVKGDTEKWVIERSWNGFVFRPGIIYGSHDESPKDTRLRIIYSVLKPVVRFVKWIAPTTLTTTENIGQGFLHLAQYGHPSKRIFENNEINLITKTKNAEI